MSTDNVSVINSDDFTDFIYGQFSAKNIISMVVLGIFVLATVHLLLALKGFYAGRYVESTSKLFVFIFAMAIIAMILYAFINSQQLLSIFD
jgi:hypothetical protein